VSCARLVHGLDQNGKPQWTLSTPGNVAYASLTLGPDGNIYGAFADIVACISPSGQILWQRSFPTAPVAPLASPDGTVYVGAGSLYALNRDGTTRWELDLQRPLRLGYTVLALGPDGTLYVSASPAGDFRLFAVRPDGTLRWTVERSAGLPPSFAVGPDQAVYFSDTNSVLTALSPEGQVRWQQPFTSSVNYFGFAGVLSNELIITAPMNNTVAAVSFSGSLLWTNRLPESPLSGLVAPGGTIYLNSIGGKAFAMRGDGNPAQIQWPAPGLPSAPSGLTASLGQFVGKVEVQWNSAPTAWTYQVWRGTQPDPTSATLLQDNVMLTTRYLDQTASLETTYYYWVKAVNGVGLSPFSAPIQGAAAAQNAPTQPWQLAAGGVFGLASPALGQDGTVVLGTQMRPRPGLPNLPGILYALDTDGLKRWMFTPENGAEAAPVVAPDGTIHFTSADDRSTEGTVYALSASGIKKWQLNLPAAAYPFSALGRDGSLYLSGWSVGLVAIAHDGTLKWSVQLGASSPPIVGADGTIYFGGLDKNFYAVDPDGQVRWRFYAGSLPTLPALGSDGTIYFGTTFGDQFQNPGNRRFYALHPDGSPQWSVQVGGMVFSGVVVGPDDTAYFGADDGLLYAVSRTGTLRWTYKTGGPIRSTPALAADGTLYVGSDDGSLYVLREDGTLQSRQTTGGPVRSSPAIAVNGMIYFGSDDQNVYAIKGAAPPAASPWPMLGHDGQRTGHDGTTAVPPAPGALTATHGTASKRVSLSWSAVAGLPSYEVSRSLTNDSQTATRIAEFLIEPQYEDFTAAAGNTYYYWVRARNGLGAGLWSTSAFGFVQPPAVGELAWAFSAGKRVRSSPAAAPDGTVYAASANPAGQAAAETNYLHALNPNLTVKWSFLLGGPAVGSPAVGPDGTIYIGCNDTFLYAVHPEGTLKWKVEVGRRRAVTSTPAIAADGTIYIYLDDSGYAISPEDGHVKWAVRLSSVNTEGLLSAPAVSGDGTIYFPAGPGLYALRPDGTPLWGYSTGIYNASSAAIGNDGALYFAANTNLHAVNTDGTDRWVRSFDASLSGTAPVLAGDGTVYIGSSDHRLYAVGSDGALKWSFQTEGTVTAPAAVGTDGTVYFGSSDGKFYALTSAGSLKWSFTTAAEIHSGPVITPQRTICFGSDDGRLYFIRTDTDLGDGAWPMFQRDRAHTGRSLTKAPVPPAPTGLTASKNTVRGAVRLEWTSAPWAEWYEVWRADSDNAGAASLIGTNAPGTHSFTDLTVGFSTPAYYWVKARNAAGSSGFSNSDSGQQNFRRWQFVANGAISSAPAIGADGTVYFGSDPSVFSAVKPPPPGRLYALTPDGTEKWEFTIDPGVGSAPALAREGTIYVPGRDRKVYALHPNGSKQWEFLTEGTWLFTPALGGDGTLYCATGDKGCYALHPDGTLFWQFAPSDYVRAPAVVGSDGTIYLVTQSGVLIALYPNGTLKWSRSKVTTEPSFGPDGTIYAGTDSTSFHAWAPDGVRKWTVAVPVIYSVTDANGALYSTSPNQLLSFDPNGTKRWSVPLDAYWATPPVLGADGLIFIATSAGTLFAVDRTGVLQWQSASPLAKSPALSALSPDGTIYLASADGVLSALQASDRGLAGSVWPTYRHDPQFSGSLGPTPAAPELPLGLSASVGSFVGRVRLSWKTDRSSRWYDVWRNTAPDFTAATLIASNVVASEFFDDLTAEPGVAYYYWIRARNGAGVSPLSSPLQGTVAAATLAWQFNATNTISTAVALSQDETIYFGTQNGRLHAINAEGQWRWTVPVGYYLRNTPAVGSDGTVYVAHTDLLALSKEGTVLWRSTVPTSDFFAPAIGPDGTVYCGRSGSLLAFGAGGTNLWSFATGGTITAAPAIGSAGTVYVASTDGNLYAIAPNGALQWKAMIASELKAGPSLGPDGTVYLGAPDKAFYAFASDSTLKWRLPMASSVDGTASIAGDGTLFVGTQNTNYGRKELPAVFPLYAVSPSGAKRWESATGSLAIGIACADNNTLFLPDGGNLICLNPDSSTRWNFVTPTNNVGIPTIGQNGRIYCSAGTRLYALNAGVAPALSSWPSYRADAQLTGRVQLNPRVQLLRWYVSGQSGFGFELSGPAGSRLQVLASTDLRNWTLVSTLDLDPATNRATFLESSAPAVGQRFYRAVALP
jgi:outer membrane protein assembly factor BamB